MAGRNNWHILLALSNVRLNVRNEQRDIRDIAQIRKPDFTPESDNDKPLPPETLTAEHLNWMRQVALLHAAEIWGLEVHQRTPDLDALDRLRGDRYGYWTDDVPHDPIFGDGAAD